jgi:anti-anti-sigma factor
MTTTPETTFHYEVDHSEDETKWKVTTITCHGRLVSDNANQIRDLVKPLISEGGHIVLDFADLKFLDSLGLGALVGLKVSAINKGLLQAGFGQPVAPCARANEPHKPDTIVLEIKTRFEFSGAGGQFQGCGDGRTGRPGGHGDVRHHCL